jgi:hypothetical protein
MNNDSNDDDVKDDINDDVYIIAFKEIIHCLPIHNYVLNTIAATITYYCGQNNTIILSLDKINYLINNK